MANFRYGDSVITTNIGTLINLGDLIREWKNRGIYFTVCHCGDYTDLAYSGFPAVRKSYALIAAPQWQVLRLPGIIVTSDGGSCQPSGAGGICSASSVQYRNFFEYPDFHILYTSARS